MVVLQVRLECIWMRTIKKNLMVKKFNGEITITGTLSENLAAKHDYLLAKHDALSKNMHAAQEAFVNTGVNVDGLDLRCEARFCERPSITTRKMMR